jgi:hypothetical protein
MHECATRWVRHLRPYDVGGWRGRCLVVHYYPFEPCVANWAANLGVTFRHAVQVAPMSTTHAEHVQTHQSPTLNSANSDKISWRARPQEMPQSGASYTWVLKVGSTAPLNDLLCLQATRWNHGRRVGCPHGSYGYIRMGGRDYRGCYCIQLQPLQYTSKIPLLSLVANNL